MGQTFNDLVTEALSNDFGASTYKSVAQQAIRDALSMIARAVDVGALQGTWSPALVAGTATYALPVDDLRILSAYDADVHRVLAEVGPSSIDQTAPSSGRPTAYAVFAGSLTLSPTPDQAYSLVFRYAHDVGTIGDATDLSTLVPDAYLNMLVAFARHRMFRLEDDAQMSQFWRAEFDRDFQRMKMDLQRGDRNRVRQVPGPFRSPSTPRFSRP